MGSSLRERAFRKLHVVCFVGYSINDPVLRYMMDALAADRMLGEVTPGPGRWVICEPGQGTIARPSNGKPKESHPSCTKYRRQPTIRCCNTLHAWPNLP